MGKRFRVSGSNACEKGKAASRTAVGKYQDFQEKLGKNLELPIVFTNFVTEIVLSDGLK
jgi:hypothetical protein